MTERRSARKAAMSSGSCEKYATLTCMYAYIQHAHTYTYIHTNIHTYIHTYTYTWITYGHTYLHAFRWTSCRCAHVSCVVDVYALKPSSCYTL